MDPRMTKDVKGEETPKSRKLLVVRLPGVTPDKALADMVTTGLASNAGLIVRFSQAEHGELSLTDMVASLQESGASVNRGDLSAAEKLLNAQAVALNSIFAELARRTALNMGEYLDATDRYMRLALKAQSQCRATLETLATIKNPPMVWAKQANFANGPQQVNNGVMPGPAMDGRQPAPAHEETGNQQTRLLEGSHNGGTYLDGSTATTAARGNPAMEAMGAVNRPAKPRRKSKG